MAGEPGMKHLRDRLDQLIAEMLTKGLRYDEARHEIERRFIIQALARTDGNVGRAATLLGMHRNTLGRKLAALPIRRRTSGSGIKG